MWLIYEATGKQKYFDASATPIYYDSTAGVCVACGLLEIAKYVSDEEARKYTQKAINFLKTCERISYYG